jgi:nitroreductase
MTVTEAIRTRKSIRAYKNKNTPIPQEHIDLLLEAAMKAPSACNTRPWSFVVVQSRETLDKIANTHPYAGTLRDASLAIIVCGLPETQSGLSEGFLPQDCGAASQNILLQAAELGLGTCWCGVYPKEPRVQELRDILGKALDPKAVPFNIIVVGYPDEEFGSRGFYEKGKVTYV